MNNTKKRYAKKIRRITIDCYLCDDDNINYLATKESTAGYIKALIREEIKKEENENEQ